MKKRLICLVLSTILVFGGVLFYAEAATISVEVGANYISVDYSKVSGGIVNHKTTAVTEKNFVFDGVNTVKVTPTPSLSEGSDAISLDSWSIGNLAEKVILPDYKYVGVTYYYDTDNPTYTEYMTLSILGGGTYAVSSTVSALSSEKIVCGEWAEAVFAFGEIYDINTESDVNYIKQIHFQPFSNTYASALKESDVLYVAKYTFYKTNPNPDALYDVCFKTSNPDAVGDLPADFKRKADESYTLPECGMTLENGTFLGWNSSLDGELHQPGEVIEGSDLSAWYTAIWEVVYSTDANVISLEYPVYSNGIINHTDGAYLYENTEYEGLYVTKAIPNPEATSATTLGLDGFSYGGVGINLEEFHWFAVSYKYESPNPVSTKMRINIMTNGNVLTKTYSANSLENIVEGKWSIALFDMTGVVNVLKPGYPHNMKQMHFYPFGATNLSNLTTDDVMYISRISFFKEKPELMKYSPYIYGYSDGTFKKDRQMTRAEACAAVARAVSNSITVSGSSPFSDVNADNPYAPYIGYCYEKGILDEIDGSFRPNDLITRSEFLSIAMNAMSVGMGHSAGELPKPKNDGNYITRGEAVQILNTLLGRDSTEDELDGSFDAVFFDVVAGNGNYGSVAEATVPHVKNADGTWAYSEVSPEEKLAESKNIDFTVGNAKVAEVDALSEARKQAILNSESDYSTISGTKYYISENGSDSNDGLSPETAWKTISKLSGAVLSSGDGVLFERGYIYRGKFTAKSGVTYSAYGVGDKPKIYGSPLNAADPDLWVLDYEEADTGKKIWLYTGDDLVDIGAITFDESVYAYKEVPSYVDGQFVVRGKTEPFDYKVHLTKNYSYVHLADSVISNEIPASNAVGKLYLRCDDGNPGSLYDDIEFNTKTNIISVGSVKNVTVDNLCIMFGGSHGVGAGTTAGLTVKNCVFGWIGGSIQYYNASNGVVTRFGNGVEIYGGCEGYTIENCYVYQNYDAGITHQYGSGNTRIAMNNIVYRGNLIEDCVYNIEYFLGASTSGLPHDGVNILIEDNILRRAGYGFGSTRPDGGAQAHIKSWDSNNEFSNYVIRNNIFDRSTWRLLHLSATYKAWMPKMEGNTYIQGYGNYFIQYGIGGSKPFKYYLGVAKTMQDVLGDKTGRVYYVEKIPPYVFPFGDGIVKTSK